MNIIIGILILVGIIYLAVKFIQRIIDFIKDKIWYIKNNKPLSKEEKETLRLRDEERQKQEQEEKEKYKKDILSGVISFKDELIKVIKSYEEDKLNLMKFLEIAQRYKESCLANYFDAEAKRYLCDFDINFNYHSRLWERERKLQLLNEIKKDITITKLSIANLDLQSAITNCMDIQRQIR